MSIKCSKCLRVKPVKFFTKLLNEDCICDFCRNGIEEQAVKRREEMKRFVNCENKTPLLTGYAETKSAKEIQKTRDDIADILEARRLAKEIDDYD